MADIGNLSFSVHLKDMTDADVAKIKSKLENLSLTLKIDGNNIKVSNTDIIKKQIEDAVKAVRINAVSIDAKSFSSQIESAAFMTTPKVRVEVLKDNLTTDIQAFLDAKVFGIKISVTNQISEKDIKKIGNVSIPVKLTVDKKIALEGLKKSLLKMTVPIGVKMKDAKSLAADIRNRMKNMPVKVDIDANKNTIRSNINQALKGQKFTADLKLNIQTVDVQTAIRQAFAKAGLQYNTTASNVRANLINTRQQKADAYSDAQQALADLRRAQAASAQAALQQKNAMQGVNNVAEKQKGVFAQLREQVANAYALYRVGRFLNTAMRIGGEFQQQHIALQTIIGDVDKANVLFERIKNLAVESPFKMLDLSKYTKQLAAFSIPYEELFDTLKRFGDLSAGLGVDMGRIILAYGQVRSAEFLKGTELRQFTEAGIPLVTELAKKYTDLRGELVSVGDVYDMISKKQVSFADVKDVLWDMTSEGGKFFNMQSALTDTLKGKLDKLADSYEIFLSEIANSNNDVLGGTLDLLADTLKHWELIQDAMMMAVSAYGTYKATLLAVSAIQKASMAVEGIQKLIASYKFLHNATTSATIAQLAFNSASKANPYVMLAVGLATIASSMGLLFSNTNKTAEATAKLNAKLQEEQDNVEESRRNADKLASAMVNEKASMDKRTDAYNRLSNIYPSLFENMTQEQAMLLKEAELRGMVADAAKKETKEKLEASLVDARANVGKAQKNVDYWEKFRTFKNKNGVIEETTNKSIKEDYDKAMSDLVSAQNLVTTIEESILLLDKKSAEQAQRVASRWFKEAQDYVNSLPKEYKGLMPKENEDRETYFERIGKVVDDLDGKIKELNEDSSAAKEVLGGYTTERDYANNIYTTILGGIDKAQQKALEDAQKNRDKQNKENEKEQAEAAKRLVQAYADSLKSEIAKIGSQWDLFKQLFEMTGDKEFASTAFTITPVWDEAAKSMLNKFKEEASMTGIDFDIDFDISDEEAKVVYGELYDSWKEIKDRIEKKGIDVKVNAAKAIESVQSIQDKIKSKENQRDEELKLYDVDSPEYDAIAKKWENEIVALKGELFELTPAFKDLFVDTTGMASGKLHELWQQAKDLVDLIRNNTTRVVYDENGQIKGRYYKDKDGNEQYIAEDSFEKLNDQTNKLSKKVPEVKVAFDNLWNAIKGKGKEGYGLKDIAHDVSVLAQEAASTADALSSMFDSLGNESAADIASFTGDMLNSVSQIGQGIASGNPLAVISGIANGISSIAQFHDKKLDRAIRNSQLEVKKLQNAYNQLESVIERQLGSSTNTQNKVMLDNLKKQRAELQKQYDLEDEKKKTDKGKLEDYKQQMSELSDQIKYFYENLASEQYNASIKDWAKQIAESLTQAFARGEDAAQAFDDTVAEILRNLATEAIRLQFIEPAMADLRNYMFGDNGIFTDNSDSGANLSSNELAGLNSELEKLKNQIESSNEYWDKINEATGGILNETSDSASGGLSNGVQSVTEDTANLLGSYLNSIRQSVHVKQQLLEKLVSDDIPQMSYIAQAQLQELNQIAANTKRNADAADKIYDLVNRVVDKGSNKIKV